MVIFNQSSQVWWFCGQTKNCNDKFNQKKSVPGQTVRLINHVNVCLDWKEKRKKKRMFCYTLSWKWCCNITTLGLWGNLACIIWIKQDNNGYVALRHCHTTYQQKVCSNVNLPNLDNLYDFFFSPTFFLQ